uniref:Initiation-control protein YabA n=1 Tax=Pseudomonas phage Aurca01 TaxID=3138527 RepID=A0AAU6W4K0_9VIRU
MTVDIEKLEALAKAAKAGGAEWSDLDINTERMYPAEGALFDLYEFANPAVVLELIANHNSSQKHWENESNNVQALMAEVSKITAENAGLKTGYEAYERVNAGLNQRIANLELCQTASLGVSGIIKSAASELGFDAAGEDSALDHLIGLARSASALRVENEALRKSLCDVMTEVDGNIRETVRDCVNGRDDVQDIYGYCDSIEAIVDAAMSKEQSHD